MGAYLCDDICRKVVAYTMYLSREFVSARVRGGLHRVREALAAKKGDLQRLDEFCDFPDERSL